MDKRKRLTKTGEHRRAGQGPKMGYWGLSEQIALRDPVMPVADGFLSGRILVGVIGKFVPWEITTSYAWAFLRDVPGGLLKCVPQVSLVSGAKYITVRCPAGGGCFPPSDGFANDSNRRPRQLEKDANRVDVDIQKGVAFVIPRFLVCCEPSGYGRFHLGRPKVC